MPKTDLTKTKNIAADPKPGSKKSAIEDLKKLVGLFEVESSKGKRECKSLLYFPVYVNTFALAFLLEKNQINMDCDFFEWSDVIPKGLGAELSTGKRDVIFCFSSSDKEDYFRNKVQQFIASNRLPYSISVPPSKKTLNDLLDYNIDIDYSNFSIKYLFFANKANIKELHQLASFKEIFSLSKPENPYLSKLMSALLARGYKTIAINSDITDESKGFLRKALHEEFGFKFQLTPSSVKVKPNNTLVVETKGGQQAFEEIKLQGKGKSDKLTFEIPKRIRYTSKTKIIFLYKNDKKPSEIRQIRNAIEAVVEEIFDVSLQNDLFENDVHSKFVDKNIDQILAEVSGGSNTFSKENFEKAARSNSFLMSLVNNYFIKKDIQQEIEHSLHEKRNGRLNYKEKLLTHIQSEAKFLQINSPKDFTECLNDHHIAEEPDTEISRRIAVGEHQGENYLNFCRQLFTYTTDNYKDILVNGLYLINLIINNPNGIDYKRLQDDNAIEYFVNEEKNALTNFFKLFDEKPSSMYDKDDFITFYTKIRIIAEDLNYLVAEESMLCDPKHIFEILPEFDLSEFEYVYSFTIAELIQKKLYHTHPA